MKVCEVCGVTEEEKCITESRKHKKTLCSRHYTQLDRHGKILERTRFDSNKIKLYDNFAKIELYNKNNEVVNYFLIDKEDVEKIKKYKWYLRSNNYVGTGGDNETIYLHRYIVDCPDDLFVDHSNHNKLDNRKDNLRICSWSQNNINRKMQSNNISGYTGVWFDNEKEQWVAAITFDYNRIHIGYFKNKEDAIKARKEAEEKHFGEFRFNANKDKSEDK
ncbi:MAG: HNH endonuclease [Eubacteriales bacterium]